MDNDAMLGKMVRLIMDMPEFWGILCDLSEKLHGKDGKLWRDALRNFLRKEPCWSNGQVAQVTEPKPTPSILELVSTVVVSATTSKFIAKDKFMINTNRDASVKISSICGIFTNRFLSGAGKIEDPISEQTLRYHKLREMSTDRMFITELGGEAKVETNLSVMFSFMEKPKNGEDDVLLNNDCANIFYIRDQNSVLSVVYLFWTNDGWDIHAYLALTSNIWLAGARVFSRLLVE